MGDRTRALLCLAGLAALTGAWLLAGLLTDGFDPVRQSISQLQRDGTATAVVMTPAFAAFALGGLAFAPLLARAPRVALTVASVATLGAAAAPLGEVRGGAQDAVHLAFGATGYVCLSVLPLLAAPHLSGRDRAAAWLAGAVASACLLGTVPADAVSGALQRAGFLAGHLWLASRAVAALRRREQRRPRRVSALAGPTGTSAQALGTGPRGRRRRTPASPRPGCRAGRRSA